MENTNLGFLVFLDLELRVPVEFSRRLSDARPIECPIERESCYVFSYVRLGRFPNELERNNAEQPRLPLKWNLEHLVFDGILQVNYKTKVRSIRAAEQTTPTDSEFPLRIV